MNLVASTAFRAETNRVDCLLCDDPKQNVFFVLFPLCREFARIGDKNSRMTNFFVLNRRVRPQNKRDDVRNLARLS